MRVSDEASPRCLIYNEVTCVIAAIKNNRRRSYRCSKRSLVAVEPLPYQASASLRTFDRSLSTGPFASSLETALEDKTALFSSCTVVLRGRGCLYHLFIPGIEKLLRREMEE